MSVKCQLKAAAKAAGKTRYVSDTLCSKEHGYERLVSTGGCTECARQTRRRSRVLNAVSERTSGTNTQIRRYGITPEQYEEMLASQSWGCRICNASIYSRQFNMLLPTPGYKGPRKNVACIDHDHVTGKVRGLLCRSCNIALGMFQDSEPFLLSAVGYLRASAT